jgi:hypothetical protein
VNFSLLYTIRREIAIDFVKSIVNFKLGDRKRHWAIIFQIWVCRSVHKPPVGATCGRPLSKKPIQINNFSAERATTGRHYGMGERTDKQQFEA